MTLFALARPIVHALDAERAHRLTIAALKLTPLAGRPPCSPRLAIDVAGLAFPNPVGLAPGFDKNAEVPAQMLAMGFGFVEVGTLTPLPQPGNPLPRLFRLSEDRSVINRMGFNNEGQAAAHVRLARLQALRRHGAIIGVNVGANKDSADRIADYAKGAAAMADVASYLCVNISSPNTPGLRALQDPKALQTLLDGVRAVLPGQGAPPLFLKLAPDLEPADIDAIVKSAHGRVDALVIGNTTITRPPSLASRHAREAGGLSGKALAPLALQRLRDFRKAAGGAIPLVAAGGIDSAETAYERIHAGASLVQIYSAMVFKGPGLAREIVRGLDRLLARDGFARLADAVGAEG